MEVSEMSSASSGCEDSGDKNPPANSEKTETGKVSFSWMVEESSDTCRKIRHSLSSDGSESSKDEDSDTLSNNESLNSEENFGIMDILNPLLLLSLLSIEPNEKKCESLQPQDACSTVLEGRLQMCDNILEQLNNDRINGIFCDVTFEVEGESFHVHKSVLQANSLYFKTMFTSDFAEKTKQNITLEGISKSTFNRVLNFIYAREFDLPVNVIYNVYKAAEMYLINSLVIFCQHSLKKLWNRNSIFEDKTVEEAIKALEMFHNNSQKMDMPEFADELIKSFKEATLIEGLTEEVLMQLNSDLLFKFIESRPRNKWNAGREISFLQFLLKWISKNPSERIIHINEFLNLVDFKLVPSSICETFESSMVVYFENHMPQMKNDYLSFFKTKKRDSISNKLNDAICSFKQNPLTLDVSLKTFCCEMGNWRTASYNFDSLVVQAVTISNEMIMLSKCFCYVINFDTFKLTKKRVEELLFPFDGKFVACAQKGQLLVTGKECLSGKNNLKKHILTVYTLDYTEDVPMMTKVFQFDVFSCILTSMSATSDAIYVLTMDPQSSGTLCMMQCGKKSYHFFDGYNRPSIASYYISNRIFFHVKENEQLLLLETFRTKTLMHGIYLHLQNCCDTENLCQRLQKIEELAKSDEGVNSINGLICDFNHCSEGTSLLVLQEGYLVQFLINDFKKVILLGVLPTVGSGDCFFDTDYFCFLPKP